MVLRGSMSYQDKTNIVFTNDPRSVVRGDSLVELKMEIERCATSSRILHRPTEISISVCLVRARRESSTFQTPQPGFQEQINSMIL